MSLTNFIILIPARAGSTRIKNKNIAEISGRSLVQRAIEMALEILPVDQIYISTDSQDINQLALSYNVKVHSRSEFAASNQAVASDVIRDFLSSELNQVINKQDLSIVYLQPTSPFRKSNQVLECLALHETFNKRPIISVRSSPILLQKLLEKNQFGFLSPYFSEQAATSNAQTAKRLFYLPNGAIYIFQVKDFINRKTFPVDNSVAYEMDALTSIDIDDLADLELARELSRNFGW